MKERKNRNGSILAGIVLAEILFFAGNAADGGRDGKDIPTAGKLNREQPATGEMKPAPQIALTFDDGPHPIFTEQLMDGLKERGVKATFFVLGKNISGNEAIVKRMQEEGHLIGNHAYSHQKLDDLNPQCAMQEVKETSIKIEQITGKGTEYFRPPFGIWRQELEYEVTMLPVLWTIDTLDWTTKNVPVTVERVLTEAKDQSIVLFHDCYASSVEAALRTADRLLEQGYEFVTADRIILAP